MIGFLSGLWGRFAAIGALVLAVLAAYLRVRSVDRAGARAEVEVEAQREQLRNVETRRHVEEDVSRAGPDERRRLLNDEWSRD